MAKGGLFDGIINDITKNYNKAVKETAEDLFFEIEKAYETAIEMFYNDYNPVSYNRTFSTYLASSGFNDPFYYETHGDTILAGIDVSGGNIPGSPYRAKTPWVFERSFVKGIHGFNRNTVITRNKNKYKDEEWKVKHIPKNMNPSSKTIMDKEFKKISNKKNVNEVFNKNFIKYFS